MATAISMNILFYGTPKEVIPVLEQLQKHFTVVGVITNPDQKAGRKQLLTPPPVKVFATEYNIPVFQPETLKDFPLETIKELKPELAVVAAYGKLIPTALLDLPKYGSINIHPSLLPKYRGPTPIQTALLNGDTESGTTIMKMDADLDHGPILHQTHFAISPSDTFDWLMKSKFAQAAIILPHIIEEYTAGKLQPIPQDDNAVTFTNPISKQDGYVDLQNLPDKDRFMNMLRAYYPWPTVWTRVKLHNGQEKVLKFLPRSAHPEIKADSPILIQMEGKNPTAPKDFFNGYPELKSSISKLL